MIKFRCASHEVPEIVPPHPPLCPVSGGEGWREGTESKEKNFQQLLTQDIRFAEKLSSCVIARSPAHGGMTKQSCGLIDFL